MLELAPGALISFFESRGCGNSMGGAIFRFSNFNLNITLPLFQVNTT